MAATVTTKPVIASASPPVLAPADSATLASASLPAADSPSNQQSLTSKEWIVPPRPKPGRKPATDTPPTKRKAQNRAAQRAFRERRAARVGELEEQMKQMEEEDEEEQNLLRADITRLEREVEQYRTNLDLWMEKCRRLERELTSEREGKSAVDDSRSHLTDAVPLPKTSNDGFHPSHDQSATPQETSTVSMGCGNCTSATRCQCIDDAFNVLGASSSDIQEFSNTKRPHSPSHFNNHKRIKAEAHDLEIDFTSTFASRGERPNVPGPEAGSPADPCGFCQDGTPCICAEMAAEDAQEQAAAASSLHNAAVQESSNKGLLPGISHLSKFTPPPSEGDVASMPNKITPSSTANPCASGPGSCAQCRADPNSTVFCQALAASRSLSSALPAGCCGGASSAGECCQNQTPSQRTTRSRKAGAGTTMSDSNTPKMPGITLTCADAYTTLSRHPAYQRASGDIANWMPKLLPIPTPDNLAGRPAMEIDAANVMSVLRDFDRRFSS